MAPAIVHFTQAKNNKGRLQICVYAECLYGGVRIGPIWSHTDAAIRRALATLTKHCSCGRPYHKKRYSEGHRIVAHSAVP